MSENDSDKTNTLEPIPATRDTRLRALDEAHQRYLHDHATDMEESHEKGIVVGVDRRNIEIAQNMKRKGCDVDFIVEMTGLPSAEIAKLG